MKTALRAIILAAATPAIAIMPASASQAQPGDLASVNRAIRAITTLKANFEQHDPNGATQRGTVLLKQPGHIRLDYGSNDLLIVADGKSLYMIDYQVAQVQRLPIRNSPIGALLDPSRDLSRYGKLLGGTDPQTVAVDVRDPEHPEYGVLTLAFARRASAPGGLELLGWRARDAQGNITTLRLSNVSYGAAVADSAFRWRDPRPNMRGPTR